VRKVERKKERREEEEGGKLCNGKEDNGQGTNHT